MTGARSFAGASWRIGVIALIYGIVGTIAAIVGYGLLQAAGVFPAPARTLDGMLAFLDRLVFTAIALALAGMTAGILMLWGRSALVGVAGSMLAAVLLVVLVRPPATAVAWLAGAAAGGALIAGGIVCLFRGLRPGPGHAERRAMKELSQ